MSKLSPMMQQYLDIKAEHKDHIVFFRLGDFYEMFFDDAVNISKELELTLTGKDCGLPERAPMCGIPYHASDTYIKRLIDKGYKVAIVEQTEDPAKAKGLVKREITRIVTPGTVIEGEMLDEAKNNYIATAYVEGKSFALCFADISTGEVHLTEQHGSNITLDIINELSKFMPSEILYNKGFLKNREVKKYIDDKIGCVCCLFDDEQISLFNAEDVILKHFNSTLKELGLEGKELATNALCGLIKYLNKTQTDGARRIEKINFYKENQFMNIDITAKRNLEITQTMRSNDKKRGTLLWVLDKTKTSMGKRYMRKALELPLVNLAQITRRQNAVGELCEDTIRLSDICDNLSGVYDLERLMTRVIYSSATPRELKALADTAKKLPEIKRLSESFKCDILSKVYNDIDLLEDISALVDNSIADEPPANTKDGGYIKQGFNADLDELREICTNAKDYIKRIEDDEKEKTGIRNLKIKYNKVFGYYIEVTNSFLSQVPDRYIRKQTLTNCERYITQELKELESKVLTSSEKILSLEAEILNEVRQYIASRLEVIQKTANAIAELDFLCSLANVAIENNYVCPDIVVDGRLEIKGGRHPVVEKMLDGAPFVPNDTVMDVKNNQMLVITGPNMAGKSTYMRQIALINIMAQIGSFIPAQSATISIVDRIFTRVGASDDLSAGQSTFMVEMSEVAHILKFATPKSLVILDEIGRGTSTYDGMSIARAVIEYIVQNSKIRCKTLFATHYHELTELENELNGIKNYNIAVKKRGDDITFLRKIVPGGADDSFGIEVAKLAGVPEKVISRAKEILSELESQGVPVKAKSDSDNKASEEQVSFMNLKSEVEEKIKNTDIDILTPIEALNMLYELKKLL